MWPTLILPGSSTLIRKGNFQPDGDSAWQHTFFQGGFSLVINQGLDAPHYILDQPGNSNIDMVPNFEPLPGWESYNVNSITITDTFMGPDQRSFDIGPAVNFDADLITGTITNRGGALPDLNFETLDGMTFFNANATYSVVRGQGVITFSVADLPTAGAIVTINVRSRNPVGVRAGVIRSFGDFLVAGNLVEFDGPSLDTETPIIVRNLAGVVRSSDAAAPGQIPLNWNPFAAGVSTADEFILTSTGVVQDMAELQGSFYIYSNNSISVMRQTGNAAVPLTVVPLTDTYGAQTTEAVVEFDGKHFVIGNQDIYLFGGHPGSIQSVADQRVRRYFFQNLNPLHNQRLFTLRYSQRDEIWICYPTTSSIQGECDEALIWNYRNNTWTIRDITSAVAGDIGPVPGGGLPTSTNAFGGNSGSNQVIQAGQQATQTLEFQNRTVQIQNNHAGTPTVDEVQVSGLLPFVSNAASFQLTFMDGFDSGANAGLDDVNFRTRPVNVRIQLLESSDPTADVTIDLPRYLTIDRAWDAARTYFAGFGRQGDAEFYTGQRVLDNDGAGISTVYRVTNGFGDGSVPGAFYRPDEDGPFYDNPDVSSFVYQDTFDVVGVRPRDLVAGATYGTTPGDGGTGNTLSAAEARWEVVGPASSEQWDSGDVARIFGETLRANTTFAQFFNARDTDVSNNQIIVEALRSSEEMGFPRFGGVSIAFAFPTQSSDADTDMIMTNGGNISDVEIIANVDTTIIQADAVQLEFFVRARDYVPFDATNPTTTGRYVVNANNPVIDRVMVAFNGNFSGADLDEQIAALVRDSFTS